MASERVWTIWVEGLARSIGVSNFRISAFERVLSVAKHKPVVNQIEYVALLPAWDALSIS